MMHRAEGPAGFQLSERRSEEFDLEDYGVELEVSQSGLDHA
jgi:hypothetical protein